MPPASIAWTRCTRWTSASRSSALSGQDDEEFAVSILNRGVQDYLLKWEGQGRTILRSIRYAIERKRAEVRLNHLAQFDPLTEIGNRQYFHDQLRRATARARRDGGRLALFFLDIDQFKSVNDTLGHHAGDQLLREVTQRISSHVRRGDVTARLGGDEFAILMEGVETPMEAGAIAQKLLKAVDAPFIIDGRQLKVTASIGVTFYPADHNDTMRLLKNADIAMYQAKEAGRNNFKFFTERMHTELLEYHDLERDIAEALSQQGFRIAFQPKVNLATRQIQGLEALLRWDCPRRGPVGPSRIIPVAETSGHIVPIGYWVLDGVCAALCRLEARGAAAGAGIGQRVGTPVPPGRFPEARGGHPRPAPDPAAAHRTGADRGAADGGHRDGACGAEQPATVRGAAVDR